MCPCHIGTRKSGIIPRAPYFKYYQTNMAKRCSHVASPCSCGDVNISKKIICCLNLKYLLNINYWSTQIGFSYYIPITRIERPSIPLYTLVSFKMSLMNRHQTSPHI